MRVRREAHSACAARSGLLLTAARTASSNCALCSCCRLVPQCIPRPQGRRRRGLRGEREVVSLKILDAKEDLQRENLALASQFAAISRLGPAVAG